jgi:ribosomal-protein-alanine N-acetyltransferase
MPRAVAHRCDEIIFRLRPRTGYDFRELGSELLRQRRCLCLNVIETERLNLREVSESDAPFILEILNDPDFVRFVADRGVRTVEDARRYVAERFTAGYRRDGFGFWLVEPKGSGVPAGICGLVRRDSLPGVDIGYAFLPPFRSKGYAYESASAVLAYARDVLGLKRLLAVTSPDNDVSIRVLEKLGLRFEGMVSLSPGEPEVRLFAADL